MDQEGTKWRRHEYVVISADGRKNALRQAVEKHPAEERELLEELLTAYPKGTAVPGIIKRQENPHPGFLQVGWSSWKRVQGVRFRTFTEIPEETIERKISPYEVFRQEEQWPVDLSGQLLALKKLGEACGIEVGLIGSTGMEILTGLPYRDRESDLDVIIRRKPESDLELFYREMKNRKGSRVDIELQIPGDGGVKLEDWMSSERLILVKSLYKVELSEKYRWEAIK